MGSLYSRISSKIRGVKEATHEPFLMNQAKRFKCWRCDGDHVVFATKGDDMKETYYCYNCKEHFINIEFR